MPRGIPRKMGRDEKKHGRVGEKGREGGGREKLEERSRLRDETLECDPAVSVCVCVGILLFT